MILTSVTKFVDFSKFLVSKLVTKVAKIYGNYLGYFENETFWWKTAGPTVWQILGYFLFQHFVTLVLFSYPGFFWWDKDILPGVSGELQIV